LTVLRGYLVIAAGMVVEPRRGPRAVAAAVRAAVRELLTVFRVGRCPDGIHARAGPGDEHRIMAVVPAHHVGRLATCPFDLDHLTTAGRNTDMQAMNRDAVPDRCLHRTPPVSTTWPQRVTFILCYSDAVKSG